MNQWAGKSKREETFAEVRRNGYWFWLYCRSCLHSQPCAVTPFLIRWGPDAKVTELLHRAKCRECGWTGGDIQWPSWLGSNRRAPWPTWHTLIPVGTGTPQGRIR